MTTIHTREAAVVNERCAAAHTEDPSACEGSPDALRIVDRTGAAVSGCVRHGAVLMASLEGGRVYPATVQGAAIETYERARVLRPYEFGPQETR